MTDDRLFDSLNASSLFDTYLLYGIVGLLMLIALIGFVVLLLTSCCCLNSISSCCCCDYRQSSYKFSTKSNADPVKIAFIRRQSSNLTDLSQLYDSCPHLINDKIAKTTAYLQTSCTTINTLLPPSSPCNSFRSFNQSVPPAVSNHLHPSSQKIHIITKDVGTRPFIYIKNPHQSQTHISQRVDRSISPAVVSIDIARKPTSERTNSPSTNIYETVTLTTANSHSPPIYESDWTNNIRKLMTELPLSPPDLVPSTGYFQQQNPYPKVLANRIKTSDSMRRANMLKRLKDDAAFLY